MQSSIDTIELQEKVKKSNETLNIKKSEKGISKSLRGFIVVVIVNYNGYKDTEECLASLRKVKTPNMYVIIVDNGSTDDSTNRLKEFVIEEKEHLICVEDNLGFSGGNNIGIRYAIDKGAEYVCLLNNDTVVDPNFLDKMLDKADNNSVVYGTIRFFSNPDRVWFAGGNYNRWTGRTVHFGYNQNDAKIEELREKQNFVTGCLLLMPTYVIEKIGMLPEHYFLYYEDTEYSLRLIENGVGMKYAREAIIYHKVSASTQKMPDKMMYYTIRNSLLVICEHEKGIRKIVSYMCVTARNIKRMIKGEYNIKVVMEAYRDFICKNFGKYSGKL